jgi:hypothetical protein
MKYRFFSRITPMGEHIKLFILALDDDKEEMYEVALVDGELTETSELMKNMIDGFQDMKEISQEDAMRFYEEDGAAEAMKKRFG